MRFLALLSLLGTAAAAGWALSRQTAQIPQSGPAGSPVASCSSAGCHGGGDVGKPSSEQSTWAVGDPHVNAYRVLFNDVSRKISENLRRPMPAYKDQTCLVCHASHTEANFDGAIVSSANDGVGCDSCHGNSRVWLPMHYETGWKSLDDGAKSKFGFVQTKNLTSRVMECARCHIGDADRIVDHDLIAAGHPRLVFEYTRFHYQPQWKKHWTEKLPPREFEIRTWFLGQIANLRACANRTSSMSKLDLSDQSCFACHQRLDGNIRRGNVTAPLWNPWSVALLPVLAEATPLVFPGADKPDLTRVAKLEAALRSSATGPDIQKLAIDVRGLTTHWLAALQQFEEETTNRRLSDADLRLLARKIAESAAKHDDWDMVAPHYLALAALYHADGKTLADCKAGIEKLQGLVKYPHGFNSPAGFDAAAARKEFASLATTLGGAP